MPDSALSELFIQPSYQCYKLSVIITSILHMMMLWHREVKLFKENQQVRSPARIQIWLSNFRAGLLTSDYTALPPLPKIFFSKIQTPPLKLSSRISCSGEPFPTTLCRVDHFILYVLFYSVSTHITLYYQLFMSHTRPTSWKEGISDAFMCMIIFSFKKCTLILCQALGQVNETLFCL